MKLYPGAAPADSRANHRWLRRENAPPPKLEDKAAERPPARSDPPPPVADIEGRP